MKLILDPLAAKEFDDAFDYYEAQEPGLGGQFRQEVWSAIKILERYPEVGQEVRPKIRRMLIRRFPYKLIYTFRDDIIYVIAVAHGYREPDYMDCSHRTFLSHRFLYAWCYIGQSIPCNCRCPENLSLAPGY